MKKLDREAELDTTITQELRKEGLVREIGRMVQELRQKAGLKPSDKIILMLELPQAVREAIQKNKTAFKKDVGAKIVEYKKSDKFKADESAKVEESGVWLGLRKTR